MLAVFARSLHSFRSLHLFTARDLAQVHALCAHQLGSVGQCVVLQHQQLQARTENVLGLPEAIQHPLEQPRLGGAQVGIGQHRVREVQQDAMFLRIRQPLAGVRQESLHLSLCGKTQRGFQQIGRVGELAD